MTDRETLEAEALKEICPCLYYDLADGIDSMTDDELRAIIEHRVKCDVCGE
jgi:redox-regulated HSP33 family molecular chaperone